jgi:DNA-binding Xre family transcriptional regulator
MSSSSYSPINPKTLGFILRRLRVEKGLNQAELVALFPENYPSRSNLCRLEDGTIQRVTINMLENICRALEVERSDVEKLATLDHLPSTPQSYLDYLKSRVVSQGNSSIIKKGYGA